MIRQPTSNKTIWAIELRRVTRTDGRKDVMSPSGPGGAFARTGEGAGLRPETPPRGSASWNSAKGSGPWNPLMGLFSGEGLHGPREGNNILDSVFAVMEISSPRGASCVPSWVIRKRDARVQIHEKILTGST